MEIKRFEGSGRMSKAVVHNNTVYLAGQTCGDANMDIQEQAKCVLAKVDALLEKYGSDRKHILSATIYVQDMAEFGKWNEIWDAWVIDGHEPVRACVQAQMARPIVLVEVSIIAAVK